ncbi:MAG: carbonic anhydrase [Pseudomonadota bacterium]
MPRFAAGVVRFQSEVYPHKKQFYEKICQTHAPEALFITCSDARIEVAALTQSSPGDLFICRNAGNIVPPHMEHPGAMTASIEYAVAALRVPHIVICGHTECGAMNGAMNPANLEGLPHVRDWLDYAEPAVKAVKALGPEVSHEERMALLLQKNVMLQLDHVKTHPAVAARLKEGGLELHGWVYDIKTGEVHAYDERANAFIPVHEHYAR